ncbi:hypothetical protein PPERSA_02269 [Pseudocohnilembus persalinus]|uniref:Uncharacterized protein n=1 Tax=Pseudocohnilembus persalinus TaxID=266149 RepID=A0A0V0QKN3_PSEPJ|nr:hypothetical protein PPERSA_02269 [Pseudocohnilembus persalinus]|eukprot:KRX02779.1 hypothetical protein PPERSA_02269 [Pseudocohnilembus persalinus]
MKTKLCQKKDHSLFQLYFNCNLNKQELLQCPRCILEDQENISQKILIQDICDENQKLSKINNWPPFEDQKLRNFANQIFQFIENNQDKDNFLNPMFQIQIDNFFDQQEKIIVEKLHQCKLKTKIQFETFIQQLQERDDKIQDKQEFKLKQFVQNFQMAKIRQQLKNYFEDKIDLDQFYNFYQQQHKNLFNIQQEVIKQQLKQQQKIQQELDRLRQELSDSFQKFLLFDFEPSKLIDLQFYKSTYQNIQETFQISKNSKKIKFLNQVNNQCPKQIYSEILDPNRTYIIKLRINTFEKINNQYLIFGINNQEFKDQQMANKNFITAFHQNNNISGSSIIKKTGNSYNKFCDFFTDNKTVLNIVFNVNKLLFEIFDDENLLKTSIICKNVENPVFFLWCNQTYTSNDVEIFIDQVEIQ